MLQSQGIGDHRLKPVLLVTYIRAKTYLPTLGQIQDQCLMSRRVSRCFQQAQRAVIEEIAISLQFNHVKFAYIPEIILAVDWLGPRVRATVRIESSSRCIT